MNHNHVDCIALYRLHGYARTEFEFGHNLGVFTALYKLGGKPSLCPSICIHVVPRQP